MTETERVAILGHLAAAAMIWRSSSDGRDPIRSAMIPPSQRWAIGDMLVTIKVEKKP